jgi:hypothetical protein
VLFAELAGVEEAGSVGDLEALPVDGLVELALPRLPLLQLVALAPRGREKVEAAVGDAVAADVGAEDAHDGFGVADVPGDQGLVPASRVHDVVVLGVAVELGAVHSISVAVMGCVGLLQLHDLFPLHFVVDPHDGFAAGRY